MPDNSTENKYDNMSDVELVQLSLKDKENFLYLMKRYESKMMRYIRRLTDVSQQEAEDILQDIFIKLYRNLNGFNPHLRFSSWIYRIAHNEIIDYYHKNRAHSNMCSINIDSNDIHYLNRIGDQDEMYDHLMSLETADDIRKVLAKLPHKYREVLMLRYFEDKKYDEISDILRKPPGTVATLINRAKSKFKKIAIRENLMVKYD